MSIQFFSKLSQNFIELLEDDEYYDVTIEVGEDPNVKIFRAHIGILCYRSQYLRRHLTSNKKNNDNALAHIKLSNILPDTFQIILKYIYGGIFSLDGNDTLDIFKVLIAADMLLLNELVDYLQKYLIENKIEWMEQNFELTHRLSFQTNNLDDLQMKEIEVWECVLKWGLAQNQTLIPDPDTWTVDDFKMMENTLRNCLPLIRFFSLSSKEFLHKVSPYKKLLSHQIYKDLLNSYMDPDSELNNNNIPLPRNLKFDGIIDSKIVNLNIASIVSRWIDKVDVNNKFTYLRTLYFPYKFKLLLRGSQHGFSPKKFHELCDNIPNTVTFIKVKGTEEILGGYNPSIWKSSDCYSQSCSFIFSFKNKDKLDNSILSHVNNMDNALYYSEWRGPSFGASDLNLMMNFGSKANQYDYNKCKQTNYEKKIRDTEVSLNIS
ncbi:hypothetical protein RclHR1_07270001 [Rhizophagus clarus]|uniref:BTB domain-containing protein n=1 Tax=Rhizophagus clarus TaxID=94130 RepID=A0A2Z6RVV5_9GLOM|nr:hypothetical protein RclHR1_07270001 [Rhizophagus clarus]GES77287.1 hypothetical protein GLOIN_2v1882676 [Rhizophagus clarus]